MAAREWDKADQTERTEGQGTDKQGLRTVQLNDRRNRSSKLYGPKVPEERNRLSSMETYRRTHAQADAHKAEVGQMRTTRTEPQRKVAEAPERVVNAYDEMISLRQEYDNVTKEKTVVQRELQASRNQVKLANAEVEQMKAETTQFRLNLAVAQEKITALQSAADVHSTRQAEERERRKEERDVMQNKLVAYEDRITTLRLEAGRRTEERKQQQCELDEMQEKLIAYEDKITALQSEADTQAEERGRQKDELRVMQERLVTYEDKITELKSEADCDAQRHAEEQKRQQSERDELQEKLVASDDKVTAFESEMKAMIHEQSRLTKAIEDLQEQLETSKQQLAEASACAKRQVQEEERQQREFEETLVASEEKVTALQSETNAMKNEHDRLTKVIEDLEEQVDTSKQQVADTKAEMTPLKTEVETLTTQARSAQSDMMALTRQIEQYKQEAEHAEEQIASYEIQVKDNVAEIAALKTGLQNAKQVCERPMALSSCLSSHDDLTPDGPDDQSSCWAQTTEINWTENELERLRQEVFKAKFNSRGERVQFKILVFGPTGAGKSTLCNGLRSALRLDKHVSRFHQVGSRDSTYTLGFHPAQYEDMWIVDMCGIFETKQITDDKIKQILSGNVSFLSKITPNLDIVEQEADMPPPGDNELSCVLVVLRAGMELSPEIKRQMNNIWQLAGEGVVSFRLVLTFIDQIDPELSDPAMLKNVLTSEKVQNVVQQMSKETGVPPTAMSVVRSYVQETETDLNTNILLMHVLEKVIHDAMEQIEKKIHEEKLRESYKQKSRNPWCNCVIQ